MFQLTLVWKLILISGRFNNNSTISFHRPLVEATVNGFHPFFWITTMYQADKVKSIKQVSLLSILYSHRCYSMLISTSQFLLYLCPQHMLMEYHNLHRLPKYFYITNNEYFDATSQINQKISVTSLSRSGCFEIISFTSSNLPSLQASFKRSFSSFHEKFIN